MKKLLWSVFILVTLLLIFGLSSCGLFDDDTPHRNLTFEAAILSSSTWEVSLFKKGGKDHSSQYKKVFLEFFQDNYLIVTDSSCTTQEGEWALSTDSTLLVIRLKNDRWKDLDDEWVVTAIDDNQLKIIDNDAQEEFHFIAVDAVDTECLDCGDITEILTDGPWVVDHYRRGDTVGTQLFSRFYFRFKSDGQFLIATDQSETWGTWRVIGNCNNIKVAIDQDVFPHSIMNEDWFILEFTNREIILRDERSNIIEEIRLRRGLPPKDCRELKETLGQDVWHIESFSVNYGASVADEFAGLTLAFSPNDSLSLAPIAGDGLIGSWKIDGQECEFITIHVDESELYEELKGTWFIKKITHEQVVLLREVGSILFEMILVVGEGRPAAICEELIGVLIGEWKVSHFDEDGDTITGEFENYDFIFKEDGSLKVIRDDDPITGNWRIAGYCQKLAIDISGSGRLDKVDEVWIITEVNNEKIKLVYEDNNHRKEMHLKAK
ncbi:MAG: hypothetical protein ACR2MX_09795 [Cyclobacteriaceae bacterium]